MARLSAAMSSRVGRVNMARASQAWRLTATYSCMTSGRSGPSAGVKDPEAAGYCRVPVSDLDWCPGPLPHGDARGAGEPDLPAGALDRDARPESWRACSARLARTQHIGEDGDRVVALEGDEG